jgi:alpha-D-ribose 1-methylphosphonate 5-triphosphate diphosphatase
MSEFTITNADVVTPQGVVPDASVIIQDGRIKTIDGRGRSVGRVIDGRGGCLLPGFVDLHCDAIEKGIEPRPNTFFPVDVAVAELDKKLAACGITTMFHSLSFAEMEIGLRSNGMAAEILRQVNRQAPGLRVRTRVHARFEITDSGAVEVLDRLLRDGEIHLFSFMDHSPGQGQFKTVTSFRDYYGPVYQKSEQEIQAIIERKLAARNGSAPKAMAALLEVCRQCRVPVASHDDDSPERVRWLAAQKIGLSEFPTDMATARAARDCGVRSVLGAPNVFRGASQSRNLNAREAIACGAGDILCSDYAPMTLVHAVFTLARLKLRPLHEAVNMVSLTPAAAVGLDQETGSVREGNRADLVLVAVDGPFPRIVRTFVEGREVFASC